MFTLQARWRLKNVTFKLFEKVGHLRTHVIILLCLLTMPFSSLRTRCPVELGSKTGEFWGNSFGLPSLRSLTRVAKTHSYPASIRHKKSLSPFPRPNTFQQGCRCDVASVIYSLRIEPWDWTEVGFAGAGKDNNSGSDPSIFFRLYTPFRP